MLDSCSGADCAVGGAPAGGAGVKYLHQWG